MSIDGFIKQIKDAFVNSDDLMVRSFTSGGLDCAIIYIDGWIDKEILDQDVLKPLIEVNVKLVPPYLDKLKSTLFFPEDIMVSYELGEVCTKVASGDIALLMEGAESFFMLSLRKPPMRAVAEPPTESVLRGPREGFIEDIKTNIALLRKRLRSPKLVVTMMNAGRYSNTSIAIMYIDGIADEKIISAVKEKISRIDIDGVIDSYYVAHRLQERKFSIFDEVGTSEKPDIVASKILEGRIAVLVDGSPVCLTVPMLLLESFQDSYDYYSSSFRSTLVRMYRLLGALFTIIMPGMYVALESFHMHLLPLKFLIVLFNATSGIPFPPAIEMLIVLLLFEILNQASVRMPRFMGISLSVVGAIVLGDTAVKAGLISSPAVLITALSAIGIFCVPDQVQTFSILRTLFVILGAVLGLYGIIIASVGLVCYTTSINSYGTPFLAPYAPIVAPDLKDGFLKADEVDMGTRPYSFPNKNRRRAK
ncbi:MAG: spore germination protein [Clostridiales bacterium]|nr:spore germination protein [Clostridiales bacterium]